MPFNWKQPHNYHAAAAIRSELQSDLPNLMLDIFAHDMAQREVIWLESELRIQQQQIDQQQEAHALLVSEFDDLQAEQNTLSAELHKQQTALKTYHAGGYSLADLGYPQGRGLDIDGLQGQINSGGYNLDQLTQRVTRSADTLDQLESEMANGLHHLETLKAVKKPDSDLYRPILDYIKSEILEG